jgi:hypothetical protein
MRLIVYFGITALVLWTLVLWELDMMDSYTVKKHFLEYPKALAKTVMAVEQDNAEPTQV